VACLSPHTTTVEMDVTVILGWDELQAVNLLVQFGCIPDDPDNLDDHLDPSEYASSDDGIIAINQQLRIVNHKYSTNMKWEMYPGDHFVLVWRTEFAYTVGDPLDNPNNKFHLNTDPGSLGLSRLKFSFGEFSDPSSIMIIDASSYYHHHIYDNDDIIMSGGYDDS
jgi:hypothetical protein